MTNTVSTPLIMLSDQVQDARKSGIFIFSLPSIYQQEEGSRIRIIKKSDTVAPSTFYYHPGHHFAFDNLRCRSGRRR